jgi:hypothetical protein
MLNLALPQDVEKEEEKDAVGFTVHDSNVYPGKIAVAYFGKADSGAQNVTIKFEGHDVNGKEVNVRQTIYISNKKGEFFYIDKNTGKQKALPGYTQMDAFFKAVTGKGIANQTTEEKVLNIYNRDAGKEIPTPTIVFMDTVDAPIAAGIVKISEEKTTRESNYKQGTGEFKDLNEFNKFFDVESGLTVVEKAAGESEPAYLATWKLRNLGKTIVKKAKVSGSVAGATAGAPATNTPAAAPKKSLFK